MNFDATSKLGFLNVSYTHMKAILSTQTDANAVNNEQTVRYGIPACIYTSHTLLVTQRSQLLYSGQVQSNTIHISKAHRAFRGAFFRRFELHVQQHQFHKRHTSCLHLLSSHVPYRVCSGFQLLRANSVSLYRHGF